MTIHDQPGSRCGTLYLKNLDKKQTNVQIRNINCKHHPWVEGRVGTGTVRGAGDTSRRDPPSPNPTVFPAPNRRREPSVVGSTPTFQFGVQ